MGLGFRVVYIVDRRIRHIELYPWRIPYHGPHIPSPTLRLIQGEPTGVSAEGDGKGAHDMKMLVCSGYYGSMALMTLILGFTGF